MFTGLIEEIGTIVELKASQNALYITVECRKVFEGLRIGDSVAVNGVCETVTEITNNTFKVFASSETLKLSTFSNFKIGQKVNLERTLRLGDRLDGHMVSGHVDGTSRLESIKKDGETTLLTFSTSSDLSRQIVKKGSVTIDGISLTITDVQGDLFGIAVIPHTLENTTLKYLKIGEKVNLETDILAKYIEKYLLSNDNIKYNQSNIDMDLLERNGFI